MRLLFFHLLDGFELLNHRICNSTKGIKLSRYIAASFVQHVGYFLFQYSHGIAIEFRNLNRLIQGHEIDLGVLFASWRPSKATISQFNSTCGLFPNQSVNNNETRVKAWS